MFVAVSSTTPRTEGFFIYMNKLTQRIAPNNNLPATHFIEVFHTKTIKRFQQSTENDCKKINKLNNEIDKTSKMKSVKTIAIFYVRENKLPTKHKF